MAISDGKCQDLFRNPSSFMSSALLAVIQLNPHCAVTSYQPKLVSQAHLHLMFNLPGAFIRNTPCVDSKEMKRTPHFE